MTDTAGGAVSPMLSYEDIGAAMDWLCRAFGFTESERYTDDDGTVVHGEITYGGGTVLLGTPSPAYQGPRRHQETCAAARAWSDNPHVVNGVHVYVEDVDAHCATARAAGARILRGPEDAGPGRLYTAADPEGQRWMFLQR
jgi:uncharacterized glyoxalase superfamily protein PhnB